MNKLFTKNKKLSAIHTCLFLSALLILSAICSYNTAIKIKRPLILLIASLFVLPNLEKHTKPFIIQKLILLYIIEMMFSQLTHAFFQFSSLDISLSILPLLPLSIAFILKQFQPAKKNSIDPPQLLKSWIIVFVIIIIHMLFLAFVLNKFYNFGTEHNTSVISCLSLGFIIFILCWDFLSDVRILRLTSVICSVFFVLEMAKEIMWYRKIH